MKKIKSNVTALLCEVFRTEQSLKRESSLRSMSSGVQLSDKVVYSKGQASRIEKLQNQALEKPYANPHPTTLFPMSEELLLGHATIIADGIAEASEVNGGDDVLLQLLPYWIEAAQTIDTKTTSKLWGQELLGKFDICSGYPALLNLSLIHI